MEIIDRAWQWPLRLVPGVYILDSGLGKWTADEDTAKQLQGFAGAAYPFLNRLDPKTFVRGVAGGEVALGALLLIPTVPSVVAGLGLLGFSASLLGLYVRVPGMRRPGSPFPSQDGIALAKDSWLAAIGLALVMGGRTGR